MAKLQTDDWVELSHQVYLTTVRHCDFCGKMVARRFLRREHDGRNFRFCDAECAQLWRDYWLPRYGAQSGSPSKSGDG